LPALPVPPLQQSFDKYLRTIVPLVSADELANTKALVAEFLRPGGVGEKLQEMLLQRKADMEKIGKSWLEDWWFKYAYLGMLRLCRGVAHMHRE